VLVLVGTLAVLAVIASPVLQMKIKLQDLQAIPDSITSVHVANELTNRFGNAGDASVRVVARTDTTTLDAYAQQWASDPQVVRVGEASAIDPQLATVRLLVKGDGQDAGARALVDRLRADRPAGVESWVTGNAANLIDLEDRLMAGLPIGLGIVVLAIFVLLYLMTRSLVIPLKALFMTVVSLAATFGVLVGVFQHGWLSGPLDTLTVAGLSPYMIVIVFAFALGLSMDYEVFLLHRIKEYIDAGQDPRTAVRHGLQRSGGIITAAAALMLIVFACFGTAKVGQIEEIGIGLFVAVLIDATIVRCLLVPATMTLLGRAAWWPGPAGRTRRALSPAEDARPVPTQGGPEKATEVPAPSPDPVH
jgi:RND superfamily putative drug exporter